MGYYHNQKSILFSKAYRPNWIEFIGNQQYNITQGNSTHRHMGWKAIDQKEQGDDFFFLIIKEDNQLPKQSSNPKSTGPTSMNQRTIETSSHSASNSISRSRPQNPRSGKSVRRTFGGASELVSQLLVCRAPGDLRNRFLSAAFLQSVLRFFPSRRLCFC